MLVLLSDAFLPLLKQRQRTDQVTVEDSKVEGRVPLVVCGFQ